MKILFICGSLEPGRDGVGDYTRRLAGEVIRQGHQAAIIALNDEYAREAAFANHRVYTNREDFARGFTTEGLEDIHFHTSDRTKIPILRLRRDVSWSTRMQLAKRFVDLHVPDWLSLQFVPYAFHQKGLPFSLGRHLEKLSRGRNLQMMFHELWLGMENNASLKNLIYGFLQSGIIRRLVKLLNPSVVLTQSTVYETQLKKYRINASLLPLFGNIAMIASENTGRTLRQKLERGTLELVIFGGIHYGAPAENLAKDFANFKVITGCKVRLTILGRSGNEQRNWSFAFESAGIDVNIAGEQDSQQISRILSNTCIGISTTPLPLIEKSSVVATMLEHGLPVICCARQWIPRGVEKHSVPLGVFNYSPGELRHLIADAENTLINPRQISDIAHEFVRRLEAATANG